MQSRCLGRALVNVLDLSRLRRGVYCMRWHVRGEQYLLWKGEELLSKILIVAVSLKYLSQVENRDVSMKSMMINSGQLPQWPASTSSGSLDVLSPEEHENLKKKYNKLFQFYCPRTARSRPGSARSPAADAAALPRSGATLRAATGGSQGYSGARPPEPDSPEARGPAAGSSRPPAALLSWAGSPLRTSWAAPGENGDFQTYPLRQGVGQGQETHPFPCPQKPLGKSWRVPWAWWGGR